MAIKTTRQGDPGQNFTQQTIGETPNSIGFSQNAKGAAQLDVKLYFPADMPADEVAQRLIELVIHTRAKLNTLGISLAGQEGR